MIAAVILPRRENYHAAISEAIAVQHGDGDRLYTNGERLAWLQKPLAGWERVAARETGTVMREGTATWGKRNAGNGHK